MISEAISSQHLGTTDNCLSQIIFKFTNLMCWVWISLPSLHLHTVQHIYTPPALCSAVGHRSWLFTKVASRSVKNVFTKAAQFVCRLFMQIVMSGGVSFQDTFQWLGQFNNDEREHKKTNTTNSLLSFSNASQIEPGAARGSAVRIRNSSHLSQLSNCQGGQIKLRDQIGEITCSHSDPDNHHQSSHRSIHTTPHSR